MIFTRDFVKLIRKYIAILFLMVMGWMFITSCNKGDEYPDEPLIEFMSFSKVYNSTTGIYDRGVLKLSFTDGDGNIGLTDSDTIYPYDYNLYITYFEVQNGDTVKVPLVYWDNVLQRYDTLSHNARIPMLTPAGQEKAIKGEIEDILDIYNFQSSFDTLLFEIYVVDRSLNKSNVIITPRIVRK
jgi:hypothetical protein